MNRRFLITALVAAGALALSACATNDVAATVNDGEITNEEVVALRTDPVGDVVDGEVFRNDLTTLIVTQATVDAAEADFGITGVDTPEGRNAYVAEASEPELEVVTRVAEEPSLSQAAVDVVLTQLAVRAAVIDELVNDPVLLESVWQDQQPFIVEVCPRHILVETEEEAVAAKARIDGGESFTVVANEVSLDTFSPGGVLACPSSPADYVEPFGTVVATAQIGELTEPFQTEFGWHIVIVDERAFPATFEEFVAEAERWVPQQVALGAWSAWREEAVSRAEIAVRSQIGRWFPQGDGILPPPDSPDVANASARP
ncbi:MAG: peptidylprolyl isomerase [Acidimicrobiia bacterium]|nr:peptidylprolyl isomerase [Acidimicrobiia bacterium]